MREHHTMAVWIVIGLLRYDKSAVGNKWGQPDGFQSVYFIESMYIKYYL